MIWNSPFWEHHKLDYLLVVGDINRFWLTNFESSYGFIVLNQKNQKIDIFLDARYFTEAQQKIQVGEIIPIQNFFAFWKTLNGRIGFETTLPYWQYHALKQRNSQIIFQPLDFQKLRMIKTSTEIDHLRLVCQKTAQIANDIQNHFPHFATEKTVEHFILTQGLKKGMSEPSFFPIVSSGKNSALIHTKAKSDPVKTHLLCDFGFKEHGYCSDFTRSFFRDNSLLKQYWQPLCTIQKQLIAMIKPGVKIATIAKLANQLYKKQGWQLQHAIGHGIGLEVHEQPFIDVKNNQLLQQGMVFTVEPGVYFPNCGGIRIEDVVVVTENGCEVLTQTTNSSSF